MEAEGFHITYQEFGQKETLHFFICPLNATRTQITSNNKEFGSGFHVFFVSLSPPTECYWKNTTPTLVLQTRPKWTYPQHCQGYWEVLLLGHVMACWACFGNRTLWL
jgi:hypothetical protein